MAVGSSARAWFRRLSICWVVWLFMGMLFLFARGYSAVGGVYLFGCE